MGLKSPFFVIEFAMQDTIYAPSSAIGGAVAVIRLSGPLCRKLSETLFSRDITLAPRQLSYARLLEEQGGTVDDVMAVFLPAPKTYTGEDMLEINCHGGYGIVQAVLSRLSRTGARPAEGGEFTRRAFLNGKMDLSAAEAVMDLIQARAEGSRKAALSQLHGALRKRMEGVQGLLVEALSTLDAAMDYPEELEAEAAQTVPALVKKALEQVRTLIDEGRRGRVLREGIRIALAGRPNVGKSSLLNALLGQERAIVTAIPGTTRDILDEETVLGGVPVRLVDTAGIRTAADEAERIGVNRAREAMESADLILLLLDGTRPLTQEDESLLALTAGHKRILVRSKGDLPQWEEAFGELTVSAQKGTGLEALKARILALAGPGDGQGCITNERHIHALEQAEIALMAALQAEEEDCAATDLREALHCLGAITGDDVDEAVLNDIFSRFCVGK